MLTMKEIRELIKLIDDSTIDEFVYEEDGSKIRLKKQTEPLSHAIANPNVEPSVNHAAITQQVLSAAAVPVQEESVKAPKENIVENLHKITSPMVGTFYGAPSPDKENYVKIGDHVKADTVVCIVEAMKLFNEIEAEVEGEIVEILVENGQLVEYGQPLFLVR